MANTELKVVVFSINCRWLVGVVRKGLRKGKPIFASPKLNSGRSSAPEAIAGREDFWRESGGVVVERSMRNGSSQVPKGKVNYREWSKMAVGRQKLEVRRRRWFGEGRVGNPGFEDWERGGLTKVRFSDSKKV